MAAELVELLIRANLFTALAVLVVLSARIPVRRLAGARAAYALWAAVPLAGLASRLPQAAAPVPIVIEAPAALAPALSWVEADDPAPVTLAAPAVEAPPAAAAAAFSLPPPDRTMMLALLWALGAAAGLGLAAWRHRRMMRDLGVLTRREDGVLQAQAAGVGPAVLGVVAPRIIVPSDFDDRFAAEERAVILDHERTHLSAGDAQINGLIVLLQCLCWFNPLIHLAAHQARLDQELACDQTVLARHPRKRRVYAGALLKSQLGTSIALGCAWPARSRHPLKQRLAMLSHPRPRRWRRVGGAAAALLIASGLGYAAWAAAPARVDRFEAKLIQGRLVQVARMVGLTELSIAGDDGAVWTVTSVGQGSEALARRAGALGQAVSIEGRLARDGVCGPVNCIESRAPFTPSPRAPSAEAVRLSADAAAPILITGEVTGVRWAHPNTVIQLRSSDGSAWRVSGVSPLALERGGLYRDDLLPGRKVVIEGFRSTDRTCAPECRAVGQSITLTGWARHPMWRSE